MQHDILELVKQLSLKDTKSLSQKALKLSSECGELASKALSYDNASGDRFRFITKEQILDEVADNILVALSIAYSLNYTDDDITSMMKDKAIHWSHLAEQDISDGKYPFEIHLTVLTKYLQGFEMTCRSLGDVKLIVLDLYHEAGMDIQVTTSTVVFGTLADAINKMRTLVKTIEEKGSTVMREKIETVPWHPAIGSMEGKYYESHATILVNDESDIANLREISRGLNFHISKNRLKEFTSNGMMKIMGTYRSSTTENLNEHKTAFSNILSKIPCKYQITKSITEYAVLDSNEEIDARWLGKTINII